MHTAEHVSRFVLYVCHYLLARVAWGELRRSGAPLFLIAAIALGVMVLIGAHRRRVRRLEARR